ncbi:MAG TPA: CBS domain-containing protein [Nocardioidaceae bacterium]|nr:CBS domain-containing protein [Nocardioidaceae bacterium]
MRISDVLRAKGSQVVTIGPEVTVRELVAMLAEYNIGAAVVASDTSHLLGIVSERDVVRRLAAGPEVLEQPVESIMTPEVHSCEPQETVDSLMHLMTDRRIRHVPVMVDGELHGIISIGDVVKSRIGELEFERDQLTSYVSNTQ